MRPAPKKKAAAAKPQSWRVSIIRKRGQYLGTVEAPNEKAAEAAAVAEFDLSDEQRRRLVNARYPYSAVQEQILAARSADAAAREAVRLQLSNLIETLNQIWRAIDLTLVPDLGARRRHNRFVRAITAMEALPAPETLNDIEFGQLSPVDQVRFRHVLTSLQWFYGTRERLQKSIREKEEEKLQHHNLALLRIHLSHLEKYLQAFDPVLAKVFDGRTLTKVDHRSMGEHIKPFIDEAEKE